VLQVEKETPFREILLSHSISKEWWSQENLSSLPQIDLVPAATYSIGQHIVRQQTAPEAFVIVTMYPSFRDWKVVAATWLFNKVQRQSKLYTSPVQFYKSLSTRNIFHIQNCRTFSKTLNLSAYDRVWIFFFFWWGRETGIWTKGFKLAKKHSTTWATPLVHFSLVILEMGCHKLFAQAGLEL
jgi:hypothetical protein